MPRIIEIKDICCVRLEKSRRARNIILTMEDAGNARVAVPYWVSFAEAEKMVHESISWIKRRIEKIKKSGKSSPSFIDDGYKTKMHTLRFHKESLDCIRTMIKDREMIVEHPWYLNHFDNEVQKAAKEVIKHTYRKEAKSYLPHRVFMLSARHGLLFRKLFIKNARTQWGSCSANNNINLSFYIMKLPEELIDYIILHELAHTVEKNHSRHFWAKLDKLTGNSKKYEQDLKKYEVSLY